MRCCRRILHISYKDHVTNEEVRAKIHQAIGPHEDLLTIVKRRKLQWYCHVSPSSGLAKTILKGTVKGGTRHGWQRKRCENNIREWTGLEFGKSQRAVEKREKWRKLVAKSSVLPQQPSRLRDWWWWWDNIRGINSKVSVSLWLVLYRFDGTKSSKTKCMLMANKREKKKKKKKEWWKNEKLIFLVNKIFVPGGKYLFHDFTNRLATELNLYVYRPYSNVQDGDTDCCHTRLFTFLVILKTATNTSTNR